MPETGLPHRRRKASHAQAPVFPQGSQARWLLRNQYDLWRAYVDEAAGRGVRVHDVGARFDRAIALAKRWMLAKLIVTILLSLGVLTAVVAAAGAFVPQLAGVFAFAGTILGPIAAVAASASALLLVARFVILRMLVRYDVGAAFLATRDAAR